MRRQVLLLLSTTLVAVACQEPLGAANKETRPEAPAVAPKPEARAVAHAAARARHTAPAAAASAPASGALSTPTNEQLARMLLQAGDARGALFESTLAVRRDPDAAAGWHLRGRAALALDEVASAREDLESAAILAPHDARVLNDYACALLLQDEPIPAAALLESAAQAEPQLGFVRRNLAIAYERVGRSEDARAALVRAAELGSPEDEASPTPAPLDGAPPSRAAQVVREVPAAIDLAAESPSGWSKQDSDDVSGADYQDDSTTESSSPDDGSVPRSAGR